MVRWLFFGTSIFAKEILEQLADHQLTPMAVVTRPDRPAHRGQQLHPSPVKEEALRLGLPLLQPAKASDPQFVQEVLAPLGADLFIIAAYGEIVKKNVLELPKWGCMNVHGSLLPAYRGAAPIQRALFEGQTQTGVCLMKMDEGLDTGPLWRSLPYPIPPDATAGEVSSALASLAARGIIDLLPSLLKGEQPILQPIEGVSYAKKLTAADGELHWQAPYQQIYAQFRAVTPKPGAWCHLSFRGEVRRLRIHKMTPVASTQGVPGSTQSTKEHPLIVACQQGGVALLEVQLEGKGRLGIAAFLRGVQSLNFIV